MKRSPALANLSRDHHHTLVVAARLRRATRDTAAEARALLLDHWNRECREHFRQEEELLLPAYAAHADPHHPLIGRVLCEHAAIRALVFELEREEAPAVGILHAAGDALTDHVRLEERQLFPLIEAALPDAELERLVALLGDEPG